jgi:hypothetical protein
VLTPRFFVAVLVAFLAHTSGAITLERVLQTTLDQNPAIQEAKSGLEQAAGSGWFFVPWCGRTPNWACRPAFRPVTGLVKAE